jgi:OFA family oxalate/formate antiporter-like MFS transporter
LTGRLTEQIGLASVYFSPLANWLLGRYGIPQTFLVLGIGASVVMLILAQFLRNPPVAYQPKSIMSKSAQQGNTTNRASAELDWHQVIKTVLFYKLWFMYFFAASAGLMIIGHIATIAKTQADWENGFYLVIVFAVFNTGGRLVAGFFSDKYGRRNIMLFAFLLQAINLAIFVNYVTPASLVLGAMLTGLCYGAFFALFPLATADFFGTKNFGVNYGLIFLAWGCAGILGPILAGWAVDKTDTYFMAYIVSASLLILAFFLTFTIKSPVKGRNGGQNPNI